RPDARPGDLRHRRPAEPRGARRGAAGGAERGDGAPLRAVCLRDGERPHRAGRGRPHDQRERGREGILPGALRRRPAEELPRRQALQAPEALAVMSAGARPDPDAVAAPALVVRAVTKSFGGIRAVDGVDLAVGAGEVVSVIGPNGAGKTTLLNLISGFYHPERGEIRIGGTDVTRLAPHRVAALGVARTFQNVALFKGMSVLDNLMLGRHVRMRTGVLGAVAYWGLAQREEIRHRA